jgi:hypothetical protein
MCASSQSPTEEPTVRHSTDLGYIPVVVRDACGAGDETAGAGRRALESLAFADDASLTDTDEVCGLCWLLQADNASTRRR